MYEICTKTFDDLFLRVNTDNLIFSSAKNKYHVKS